MITGTITLNNLTEEQVALILEAEVKSQNKLAVKTPAIQQQAGSQALVNGVALSWNDDAGYELAAEIVHRLFHPEASTEKAQ